MPNVAVTKSTLPTAQKRFSTNPGAARPGRINAGAPVPQSPGGRAVGASPSRRRAACRRRAGGGSRSDELSTALSAPDKSAANGRHARKPKKRIGKRRAPGRPFSPLRGEFLTTPPHLRFEEVVRNQGLPGAREALVMVGGNSKSAEQWLGSSNGGSGGIWMKSVKWSARIGRKVGVGWPAEKEIEVGGGQFRGLFGLGV